MLNTKGIQRGCPESFVSFGGAEGDRTPDLMNAIHALSQLSYGPIVRFGRSGRGACHDRGESVPIQSAEEIDTDAV